ncbi:flavin-containing monooxygenase FMO GS-OX-like 4 isoform X2 [Lolium perenne]|uniref:flavin-containing monooxygenase FMO GS-OX-like 4 isoform X2 n=1 Tax=Lolium perenne TaxID=4522 RepID=UPI0021EAB526|nr:flavin-containing monooxygenase FMO GS-OX-like 4 isoform X2 [Lolium perenne]
MPSRSLRVAVIGAGAAGLVAARELRREGHTPVVFERTDDVGGTWVYDDADATASRDPLAARRSNLYASLRTNLPRQSMGFFDFPFAAGPDGDPRTFPGHEEVLRYLREFARRFDLHGLVRLETEVVRVSRDANANSSWRVRYSRKLAGSEKREEEEEVFDAVVVCNGHYYQPHVADIAGMDVWPGKQLHSNTYRVPEPFQGQVVLVIGCSVSGMDISRDIAGVAKEVHVASRSAPAATCERLPGHHTNIWLHSMVDRAEEDGSVVFQDGSRIKPDVILHCTGYEYSFPFLGDDATISVDDNRVGPLYKHVFPPQVAPQLSFIGLPLKVIPFTLFELQSNWVAGVLSGRIELPSEEEMMRDVMAFYSGLDARGWPRRYTHVLGDLEFEYENWLAGQFRRECIEDWRRQMFAVAMEDNVDHHGNHRDMWDRGHRDHLLVQANREFTQYFPAVVSHNPPLLNCSQKKKNTPQFTLTACKDLDA